MTATSLRQLTCEILRGVEGFSASVHDSRTTPLAASEIPAYVVITPSATVKTEAHYGAPWTRQQALEVFAEYQARDDESLAAAGDTLELAAWAALMASPEWLAAWERPPTWSVKSGRSADTDRRRGVVLITISGAFPQGMPDPSDLAALHEIRTYTIPGDQEIPEGGDPEQIETRVPCAGAEEE